MTAFQPHSHVFMAPMSQAGKTVAFGLYACQLVLLAYHGGLSSCAECGTVTILFLSLRCFKRDKVLWHTRCPNTCMLIKQNSALLSRAPARPRARDGGHYDRFARCLSRGKICKKSPLGDASVTVSQVRDADWDVLLRNRFQTFSVLADSPSHGPEISWHTFSSSSVMGKIRILAHHNPGNMQRSRFRKIIIVVLY